jgi:hypothetical protein
MKIRDKVQALKHSSKYKRDYELFRKSLKPGEYISSTGSGTRLIASPLPLAAQEFCLRWRIPFPIIPDDNSIEIIPPVNDEEMKKIKKEFYNFPAVMQVSRRGEAGINVSGLDDSLCLTVTIDMTQPFSDIQHELKEYYDRYSPQVKPVDKRNSDSKLPCGDLDHWDVYRRIKAGETERDIARSLTGSQEGINDDSTLKACYEAVKRALKKAEQQIEEVEVEIIHN